MDRRKSLTPGLPKAVSALTKWCAQKAFASCARLVATPGIAEVDSGLLPRRLTSAGPGVPYGMSERTKNDLRRIVPLFVARVEHLKHAPTVSATCERCGHVAEVPVTLIKDRLPDWYRIGDLGRVMRCAESEEKGNVVVDARRALGYTATREPR
jgi:hypothetical protein